jgi:hypothetical protein
MADRRFFAWMAGLVAIAFATGGVAVWLVWWASDLLQQVDDYYTSPSGTEPAAVQVSEFYDRIGSNAFAMTTVASPLLAGTVFAVFAGVTVLAQRWEWRHR